MPSAWHKYIEPLLRIVRPAVRPLESLAGVRVVTRALKHQVRTLRAQHSGQPPVPGAPRTVVLAQLRPELHLEHHTRGGESGTSDRWRSIGIDPQFVADCNLRRGWTRLRLKLQADTPARVVLYVDSGHGFNHHERFELGDIARTVQLDGYLRLPQRVRRVRLDPLDRTGRFSVETFELQHINVARFWKSALRSWWQRQAAADATTWPLLYAVRRTAEGDLVDLVREIRAENVVGRLSEGVAYARWRTQRSLSSARRRSITRRLDALTTRPTISVLVPVYNAPIPYLRRCIDSVRAQIYPHWELCIADDCSPDPAVRRELERYARLDPRIKVTFRESNGNISAATNSALALATGEYVALLDNDDEIQPHALALNALFISADPSVDVLYSDEDKIDTEGRHFDPFFKPDWSPEYLQSCMYLGHLGVYRRSLVEQVGRFRSAFDGSQDYDLALRVAARTTRIRHIPDVLYHWRTLPTSTAADSSAKPAAYEAARRALADNLRATGTVGTVEHAHSLGYYRTRTAVPKGVRVSIVVPFPAAAFSGQRRTIAHQSLRQIARDAARENAEVLVVSNVDPGIDGTVHVPAPATADTAARTNLGAARASGDVLVFLRSLVQPRSSSWLPELLSLALQPQVGAVGAKTYDRNGRLSHVGVVLVAGEVKRPYLGFPDDFPGYNCTNLVLRNWSAVQDVCLATRRSVFAQLGGFDPADGDHADVGYCLRLRALALRVVWTPYVELNDLDRTAEQERPTPEEVRRRFRTLLPTDPFYSANLTGQSPLFRVEPRPATVVA